MDTTCKIFCLLRSSLVALEVVSSFVLSQLPPPPGRVLEVGAGSGALARELRNAGYEVMAIDPEATSADVLPVSLLELTRPRKPFDAAVAVLSLHHVHPLEASCVHLAELMRPGAPLVVDEFDVACFDKRAAAWWLEQRPFFGGLQRERTWVFWRRVLHTCHHRTQVQTWLRLAGQHVPAIYGPSGDVTWDEADPTYPPEAARRGATEPGSGFSGG
jgi:SAM-dependent methyltransferase